MIYSLENILGGKKLQPLISVSYYKHALVDSWQYIQTSTVRKIEFVSFKFWKGNQKQLNSLDQMKQKNQKEKAYKHSKSCFSCGTSALLL